MARLGVNYGTTKQAAIKLLSQGIPPSVQKIRDILGTGSNTTIAEHLKVWREEHTSKEIYHLPANMPKELISTFEVLWQTAMEYAEKQLSSVKIDLNVQQEKMQQEKVTMEQTLKSLNATLDQAHQKIEEKTNQLQALQTEFAVTQERLEKQIEHQNTLKKQYEERFQYTYHEKEVLREKSEALQVQLTQLQQATQQQLTEQAEKHQASMAQAHALQEQSEARWLNLIDQARTEAKESNKHYETTLSKQSKQIGIQQNTIEEFKNQAIAQQSAVQHAQAVTSDLKDQLRTLQGHYNDAIVTTAVLKAKLEDAKPSKSAVKNQIK